MVLFLSDEGPTLEKYPYQQLHHPFHISINTYDYYASVGVIHSLDLSMRCAFQRAGPRAWFFRVFYTTSCLTGDQKVVGSSPALGTQVFF